MAYWSTALWVLLNHSKNITASHLASLMVELALFPVIDSNVSFTDKQSAFDDVMLQLKAKGRSAFVCAPMPPPIAALSPKL